MPLAEIVSSSVAKCGALSDWGWISQHRGPRRLHDLHVLSREHPLFLLLGHAVASRSPYLPDFRPLALPRGLEDAPVVHQLDPGDLWEVGRPHHWLSHGQFALPT